MTRPGQERIRAGAEQTGASREQIRAGHGQIGPGQEQIRIRQGQVWRYLGYRSGVVPEEEVLSRIEACERKLREAAAPKSLLLRVPVVWTENVKNNDDCSRGTDAAAGEEPHEGRVCHEETGAAGRRVRDGSGDGEMNAAGRRVRIAGMEICSRDLLRNLSGCEEVVLFAATLGPGPDMLIRRATAQRMSDAVIYQAVSTEMVEAYCDELCAQLRTEAAGEGLYLKPRFSPGYGDLPLSLQKDFLRALDAPKKIGLTLTDSLLMMPSKSVTAFIGLTGQPQPDHEKDCGICPKKDCAFRRQS